MGVDKQQLVIPIFLNNVKAFIIKEKKTIIFDLGRKGDCDRIIHAYLAYTQILIS